MLLRSGWNSGSDAYVALAYGKPAFPEAGLLLQQARACSYACMSTGDYVFLKRGQFDPFHRCFAGSGAPKMM